MKPFPVSMQGARATGEANRQDLVRHPEHPPTDPDQPGLVALLGFILDHRWLVATVTILTAVVGTGYAMTAAPIYRADAVIQVEDKSKSVGPLDELSGMLTSTTPAQTEMEIIRSRWLLGAAVDDLRLDIEATPRYFPALGAAVARARPVNELSPPVSALGRFAWGGERIDVTRFEVAPELEGVEFTIVAGESGTYELRNSEGDVLLSGTVGETARDSAGSVTVQLSELRGHPGTSSSSPISRTSCKFRKWVSRPASSSSLSKVPTAPRSPLR
jgi:tyrosine-protein kinase Etk/Wzc